MVTGCDFVNEIVADGLPALGDRNNASHIVIILQGGNNSLQRRDVSIHLPAQLFEFHHPALKVTHTLDQRRIIILLAAANSKQQQDKNKKFR